MLDNPTIHYDGHMLGLATDNHEYGSIQQKPMEQVIWLWQFKRDGLDEIGWVVWTGLLTVEESARLFDDIEITQMMEGVCWLEREVAIG